MGTESKRQWWQQLGGMSQSMLFLHGHIAHADGLTRDHVERKHHVHDAVGQARHERARQRLNTRCLRAMTSLSLFR